MEPLRYLTMYHNWIVTIVRGRSRGVQGVNKLHFDKGGASTWLQVTVSSNHATLAGVLSSTRPASRGTCHTASCGTFRGAI